MEWKSTPKLNRENIRYIDMMGKVYIYNDINIVRKDSYDPWKTIYSFTIYGKIMTVETDYIDGPETSREEFIKTMNQIMGIIDSTIEENHKEKYNG